MRTYYTVREASEYLGVGIRSVRRACASGELPHKTGGRGAHLIELGDLMAYTRAREAARERNGSDGNQG